MTPALRLSILICSLEARRGVRGRLLHLLEQQRTPEVEVLVEVDDGALSVGSKRNRLLARAAGDYVAFVDDDDLVSDDYLARLLEATRAGADCVALHGIVTLDPHDRRPFVHSRAYDSWFERSGCFYRSPNHLSPVRRPLAVRAGFPDTSHGEDRAYSEALRPLLGSEAPLPGGPAYFYFATPASRARAASLRFLFKYPTRGRPALCRRALETWYGHLSGRHPYTFVLSIDADDGAMNHPEMRAYLASLPNLQVCHGPARTKVQAINADIDDRDFDVLVLVSDDMLPEVRGFDEVIVADMARHFPDLEGCLQYRDGLQDSGLNTLPIMGRRLYDRFGYVYHPAYVSEWCDNEMTEVTHAMGKAVRKDRVLIRHRWVGAENPDALHARNSAFFHQDRSTFDARRRRAFASTPAEDQAFTRVAAIRHFDYVRVGHDRRELELRPDRRVGSGAARLEQEWDLVAHGDGTVRLLLSGQAGVICRLAEGEDGVWRGHWTDFERMPIELVPLRPTLIVETAHEKIAATRFFRYARVGHDERVLELRPDGTVGRGRARLETTWRLEVQPGAPAALLLSGEAGTICRLQLDGDGVWRGHWTQFERMPILLAPAVTNLE